LSSPSLLDALTPTAVTPLLHGRGAGRPARRQESGLDRGRTRRTRNCTKRLCSSHSSS